MHNQNVRSKRQKRGDVKKKRMKEKSVAASAPAKMKHEEFQKRQYSSRELIEFTRSSV